MIGLLKLVGTPGSLRFLFVATVAGVGLVRFTPRFRRTGILWLAGVYTCYLTLSLPVVATTIVDALPAATPAASSSLRPIRCVIVLDGDNRRGRVRTLTRMLDADPDVTVWILGDRWILEALDAGGLRRPEFRYDAQATTTYEQMRQVNDIAGSAPGRTVVIASRLQAPRVEALAAAGRVPVTILPSPIDDEPAATGVMAFVPAYTALRASRDALYEHAALAYYRWRGRIP